MLRSKNKNLFIKLIIFLTLLSLAFIFRSNIAYNLTVLFGYEEFKAKKYSFMLDHEPYKIINILYYRFFKKDETEKYELEVAIDLKKNFIIDTKKNDLLIDKNFYSNKNRQSYSKVYDKLEFAGNYDNKPKRVWAANTFEKVLFPDPSKIKRKLHIQSKPQICADKLVYARPDGIIGALEIQTGKKLWTKRYGKIKAGSIRGFYCDYNEELDINVIIFPTGSGVYCIDSRNGLLIKSRCNGGHMGIFETRVKPIYHSGKVFVATYKPAGMEAYNFKSGKLLWRTDFEWGKSFYGIGSNPWCNFNFDKKNNLILVNTGSPAIKSKITIKDNYKFSGSLLALNPANGKIEWQFQEHKADTWNLDFVGKPLLSPEKINGKDVVITFSKSGSAYYLDVKNGLPLLKVKEEILKYGDFTYKFKKAITPENLIKNTDYYNYFGKDCKNCYTNTSLFGSFPPILKYRRVYNGYAGGAQWPGGLIDPLNKLLIVPSNDNLIVETYSDYISNSKISLSSFKSLNVCTSCHIADGGVNIDKKNIVPSLLLSSKIYDLKNFKKFISKNNFHSKLSLDEEELKTIYDDLKNYDDKILSKNAFESFYIKNQIGTDKKTYMKQTLNDLPSKKLPMGKVTAFSLKNGKKILQIPAGKFKLKDGNEIIGSRSSGGITSGGRDDGISFFTGTLDKKVYAIQNKNGLYLWSGELPNWGSAPPLVHNFKDERWIFVMTAPRGSLTSDTSLDIVAFKQIIK